jgi:hypothetical protein
VCQHPTIRWARIPAVQHRLKAFNTATASANKIHDDAVASSLGFRGGLVPGVDVFAYLCHLPAARWGRPWLERGTIDATFRSPVYDGDEVVAEAQPLAAGPDGTPAMELWLDDSGGARCAEGRATLPERSPPAPDPSAWPSGAVPDDPPPATHEALTARPFGSLRATFRADRAADYLQEVREDLALFGEQRLAHPGWLLRSANFVLASNVALGPWIHTASRVQLLGTVGDGDEVETRAVVTGTQRRSGHHLVDLDVLRVVGGRPVARTAHTAIFQPRGVDGPAE